MPLSTHLKYQPCPCGSPRKAKFCCLASGRWQCRPSGTTPPRPRTGRHEPGCYAACLNDCGGKLSREHYFSRSLLEAIGEFIVSGFTWAKEEKRVGINALTSKVLCERHNNALSTIDPVAERLFTGIRRIDAAFGGKVDLEEVPDLVIVNGPDLQRWMLKALCGLVASGASTRDEGGQATWRLPDQLVQVLFGHFDWPGRWDLYVRAEPGTQVWSNQAVGFQLLAARDTEAVLGMTMNVGGIEARLLLGHPGDVAGLLQRPSALVFEAEAGERTIDFGWENGGSLVRLTHKARYDGAAPWMR